MPKSKSVIKRDEILEALETSRRYVSEVFAHAPSSEGHKKAMEQVDGAIETLRKAPKFFEPSRVADPDFEA